MSIARVRDGAHGDDLHDCYGCCECCGGGGAGDQGHEASASLRSLWVYVNDHDCSRTHVYWHVFSHVCVHQRRLGGGGRE